MNHPSTRETELFDVGATKSARAGSRARWWILACLLISFTAWTYLAVSSGSRNDVRERRVLLTTLTTITGPFVGAIARNGQQCCLDFSLRLATITGPILALGMLAQWIPYRFQRGRTLVRLVPWTLGWFAWLLAGQVSFVHALF